MTPTSSSETQDTNSSKRPLPSGSTSTAAKKCKIDKFQEGWVKRWPWLEYESDVSGMFCATCKKVYASDDSVFVSRGCRDFKTSALTRHASSKKHQSAVEKEKLARKGSITTAVSRVITANEEGVLCAMRTAYFMAKEDLAMSKHKPLMEFLNIQGCSVASSSQFSYSHSESVAEFHEVFCDVIQDEILCKIRTSPFLSIIIDETTDISVHKKLIVYVKLLNGAAAQTHFLRNVDIFHGSAHTM